MATIKFKYPQSSCQFTNASQKVYGLGYKLIDIQKNIQKIKNYAIINIDSDKVSRTAREGMVRLKRRAPVRRQGIPNCTGRYGAVETPCACQNAYLTKQQTRKRTNFLFLSN